MLIMTPEDKLELWQFWEGDEYYDFTYCLESDQWFWAGFVT